MMKDFSLFLQYGRVMSRVGRLSGFEVNMLGGCDRLPDRQLLKKVPGTVSKVIKNIYRKRPHFGQRPHFGRIFNLSLDHFKRG